MPKNFAEYTVKGQGQTITQGIKERRKQRTGEEDMD